MSIETSPAVGNDGLTDKERQERADRYMRTAGSRRVGPAAAAVIAERIRARNEARSAAANPGTSPATTTTRSTRSPA